MPQIASPEIVWYAGQTFEWRVSPIPAVLANGRTLAEFNAFVFTVRQDPLYPRRASFDSEADPVTDAWDVVLTQTDGTDDSTTSVLFDVASAVSRLAGGTRRYAIDMIGRITTDGTEMTFVPTTWLTVKPRTTGY